MSSNKIEKYYPLILVLFTFMLFSNSLRNNYCIDDQLVTALNHQVQKGIGGIPEIFTSNYTVSSQKSYEYRPLTKATFAVEYALFGENTIVSHLINLLLYSLICVILYRLTKLLFSSKLSAFALVATVIFLVHPTHTEVVSSLKNREELLAFLFCLGSILYFIRHGKTNELRFFIAGAILYLLALFTKLTCLPFILIIPLCVYYSGVNKLKTLLSSFLSLTIITALFFFAINSLLPGTYGREIHFMENPVAVEDSSFTLILNSLQTMWIYIKLYFWPHPLSYFYGYDVFPLAKTISPQIFLAFLIHGFMTIYALVNLPKRNILAFAFLFYLLNMSMYYNLVFPVPGIIADRALFISSFGFSLALAFFLSKLSFKKMIVLCIILTIPASIKTFSRNYDWKDDLTLVSHDIQYLKNSAIVNLAYATLLRDEWEKETDVNKRNKLAEKTIDHYLQTLKIKPDLPVPYNEIGEILFNHYGNRTDAQAYFEKAISLLDVKAEFHFNLGTSYFLSNEYEKAEQSFLRTVQLEPGFTKAYHNLFLMYMTQKKYEQAFEVNSDLMEQTPDEAHPHYNFGKYYLAQGDTLTAKGYFENADFFSPENKEIIGILQSLRVAN